MQFLLKLYIYIFIFFIFLVHIKKSLLIPNLYMMVKCYSPEGTLKSSAFFCLQARNFVIMKHGFSVCWATKHIPASCVKVSAHWVRNFRTLKNKYDLTLCQSRLHTASETFVHQKEFGSGSIFCVFASVACILIGKDGEYEKTEKRMR